MQSDEHEFIEGKSSLVHLFVHSLDKHYEELSVPPECEEASADGEEACSQWLCLRASQKCPKSTSSRPPLRQAEEAPGTASIRAGL